MRESIAPGAFDAVLRSKPLVHLNFGHDMNRAIAATDVPAGEIGSLVLEADAHGLRFLARVDRADPDAQALAVKMSRGVARQASFAFTIGAEDEPQSVDLADGRTAEVLRITEVRSLMDVCVTPQGAYAQTEATLRAIGGTIRADPGLVDYVTGQTFAEEAADTMEPVETFQADVQEAIVILTDLLGEYPSELAACVAPLEPGETVASSMFEEVAELAQLLAGLLVQPGQPDMGGSSMVTAYTKAGRAAVRERQVALARLRAKARATVLIPELKRTA